MNGAQLYDELLYLVKQCINEKPELRPNAEYVKEKLEGVRHLYNEHDGCIPKPELIALYDQPHAESEE